MSESYHWYNGVGSSAHFRADGSNTTLRDARKENLYPSATTIISVLEKPQLSKWIKENAIKTAFQNLPLDGEEMEGYVRRISNLAYRETSSAAQFGTDFHKSAEDYFNGKPMDERFRQQLSPVIEWKESKGISFDKLEHQFASTKHGFGGTVDIICSNQEGQKMIADYKTRKSNPKYKMRPYGQEILQIGAYSCGVYGEEAVLNDEVFGCNIFVSSTEPGVVQIHGYKPDEVRKGWELFQALAEVWFKVKKYDPRSK